VPNQNQIQKNARDVYSPMFSKIDYDTLERDILQKVLDHDFDPAFQIRGFVKLLCNTPHYQDEFVKLSPSLQTQVQNFIKDPNYKGDINALDFKILDHKVAKPGPIKSLVAKFSHHMHDLPVVYEDEQNHKVMEVKITSRIWKRNLRLTMRNQVVYKERFQNWGHNVSNTPLYTFIPTTVLGVQNVVLYAIKKNLRVRCAGYRHSWAPVFGEGGEILISFVNLEEVTTVPDPITIAGGKFTGQGVTNLMSVELVGGAAPGKQLVRAGAAVTSEDFRRWQLDNKWVLPVDTLLVEVTMGGIASGICHGAGIKHNAIPDYVRSIEYVDCKGQLQVVDSSIPKLLSVAAGNFGLVSPTSYDANESTNTTFLAWSHYSRHIRTGSHDLRHHETPKNRHRPCRPTNAQRRHPRSSPRQRQPNRPFRGLVQRLGLRRAIPKSHRRF